MIKWFSRQQPDLKNMDEVLDVKRRHEQKLLQLARVVGVGVGSDEDHRYHIRLYVEAMPQERYKAPHRVEGVPVSVVRIGHPRAFGG